MMRVFVSLILLFAQLASSCQSGASYKPKEQHLRLNIHSEPPTLDLRKATDTTSISVIHLCFEGLLSLDENNNPIPALADRYEHSDDFKTYTFYLRDAKWSDGMPITAYDFEKTWKTVLSPSFPSEFASDLFILKNGEAAKCNKCSIDDVGVKALDAKTLLVELDHSAPYFLQLATIHCFFAAPSHITDLNPNWTSHSGKDFVCSGPFILTSWRHQDLIELEKNPNYWDREVVCLEKISLTIVEDENTELTMFQNGELDWVGSPVSTLPMDALANLKKHEEVVTYPMSGVYYYVFNTKEFPFNNVHIRRAFSLSINRQAIVDNILQSGQIPAMALIPPTLWKEKRAYFLDYDLKEARKEFDLGLKELNVTASQLPPITLSFNTATGHHKIAQAIQEIWQRVFGVSVRLENKEWKVFLDEIRHHNFQVARMGGIASYRDPLTFLEYYKYLGSVNNNCQWKNVEFTRLIEESEKATDPQERKSLLMQAEKILIDEMPIAPIYFYTGSYIKKPYVKNVKISDLHEMGLKTAYLETR
ncbi:MAG: peptide ABC transporter substrate-binding protein [Chlamydiales bacterium]|nr:peptide ABC transporter substrate-binding protein [Chlamydiales bacterium]